MRIRKFMVYDLNLYDLALGSGGMVRFSAVTEDPPADADMMN